MYSPGTVALVELHPSHFHALFEHLSERWVADRLLTVTEYADVAVMVDADASDVAKTLSA